MHGVDRTVEAATQKVRRQETTVKSLIVALLVVVLDAEITIDQKTVCDDEIVWLIPSEALDPFYVDSDADEHNKTQDENGSGTGCRNIRRQRVGLRHRDHHTPERCCRSHQPPQRSGQREQQRGSVGQERNIRHEPQTEKRRRRNDARELLQTVVSDRVETGDGAHDQRAGDQRQEAREGREEGNTGDRCSLPPNDVH